MSRPATETARTGPADTLGFFARAFAFRPRKPCGLSPCAPRRRTRAVARTRTSGGSPSAWRPTEGRVRTNRWWAAKRRQPPTGQRSRRAQARSRSRALRRGTAGRVERPAGGGHAASRQADRAAARAPAKPVSSRHAMIAVAAATASLLADVMLVLHRTITRSFEAEVLGLDSCQPGTSTCVGALPITSGARAHHAARMRPKPGGGGQGERGWRGHERWGRGTGGGGARERGARAAWRHSSRRNGEDSFPPRGVVEAHSGGSLSRYTCARGSFQAGGVEQLGPTPREREARGCWRLRGSFATPTAASSMNGGRTMIR